MRNCQETQETVSCDELRALLDYDPETGVFTWRVKTNSRAMRGSNAGTVGHDGRVTIRIRNRRYRAHRLAWLYVHGEWPTQEIDHINGDPGDNRIANLRVATRAQNLSNRPRQCNNKSGHKGVYLDRRRGKWQAQMMICGKSKHLGSFDAIEDAAAAYRAASIEHFGEFAHSSVRELANKNPGLLGRGSG
jgi:hypothetical protein